MSASVKQSAVVLLSGGMDSTVLLHMAAAERSASKLLTLSVHYGQRHACELECAAWQAERVGVASHRVVDIGIVGELVAAGSALVEGGADVPDLADVPDSQLGQPPTYVPNRNMILLSIAAAYAEANGAEAVYYGAQAHDEYGYWDCTPEFLARINAVLSLNRGRSVEVRAPLMAIAKPGVVARGRTLGVDFARTWSCYRGGDVACGTCPTCVERLKAFAEAGADDPIPYSVR